MKILEGRRSFALRQKKDKFIAKLLDKHPLLFARWVQKSEFIEFNDSPWTQLAREVNQSRLALITTGGVHLKSQTPFDMTDPAGDPTFREIPANTKVLQDRNPCGKTYSHRDNKDLPAVLLSGTVCSRSNRVLKEIFLLRIESRAEIARQTCSSGLLHLSEKCYYADCWRGVLA